MSVFLNPADHPELDALLASCADEPWNADLRLILADWLEENGDPRAELYRLAAEGKSIESWLSRYVDDWLGADASLWLKPRRRMLMLDWDRSSAGKGARLLEEGWVNTVICHGAQSVAMVERGARLGSIIQSIWEDATRDLTERLKRLPALRSIEFSQSLNLSNAAIAEVAEIATLREVRIPGCTKLTNLALKSLRDIPRLEGLSIHGCHGMTAAAAEHLGALTSLTRLDASSLDWFGDEALPYLAKLTSLEQLDLSCCLYLTDALFDALARLPKLTSLALAGSTTLVDWGEIQRGVRRHRDMDDLFMQSMLRAISNKNVDWSRPRRLSAEGRVGVTREGLRRLAGMTTLERLDLRFCQQVDDALLGQFATMPRLKSLILGACESITDAGWDALSRSTSLEKLDVGPSLAVSDTTLEAFAKYPNLKQLHLGCMQLTDEAVGKLAQRLPRCRISHPGWVLMPPR